MLNFTFHNPTKIFFGKGQIASIQQAIPKDKRVLITYGSGSIKRNSTYDEIKAALVDHTTFEFSGIEPNPTYETLSKAVALVKAQKIDFLLAVGGGSVIDGTKFIAAAACFEGEAWDILENQTPITRAIPLGSVLTLSATGSEMNGYSVVTREETQDKLFFHSPWVYPVFSVLDPTKTYTLPARQISNGIVDPFVHVVEQYLTYPVNSPVQDRFAEGLLLTLIEEGPKALADPSNYEVRSNLMWCAALALNDLIGVGVPQDWTTHIIGHEITARHGLDHAQTLAIILPNTLTVRKAQKREKLLQYASRVWGLTEGDPAQRIDQAIEKTRAFFEQLRMKTRLSDYGIEKKDFLSLVGNLIKHKFTAIGEHQDVTPKISEQILELSL